MGSRKRNISALLAVAFVLLSAAAGTVWNWEKGHDLFAAWAKVHEEHGDENDRAHKEHDEERGDHDEHADEQGHHDEHGDEEIVRLDPSELAEFGIEVKTASSRDLELFVELPGEIVLNADRVAHVVPRIAGIVRKVRKKLGDKVKAGEVMAVTDSRELADAKGGYLAARERLALANSKFKREEGLWKKKISSEQEYLDARQAMVETRIEIRSAEQKLHALGFSERYVRNLPNQPDVELTRYKILAPIDGTVIAKHITLGEALKEDAEIFVVADLSSVWADLRVYQKDLAKIRKGQKAVITVQNYPEGIRGEIFYVGPLVGESTRTGLARVELPNPEGSLRPGSFITAKVAVDIVKDSLIVPKSALLNVHGETSVFVQTDEGFEPRPVQLGKANETDVEITGGLDFGDQYVAKGGFTLKAQLSKGAFGDGHNH